jgi:NAD(P) transhydrogenase subunit alpha
MRIAVPVETAAAERRVALVPDSVARLVKAGHQVRVQRGAGAGAFHSDEAYASAGASLVDGSSIYEDTDLVAKVRAPSSDEAAALKPGTAIVALLQPAASAELFGKFAAGKVTAFAMELVPRITRAQSMDALSSQATIAGYKAVLLGAAELPKLLPMLTTAAGTLAPSKVFVIGAGVAGLQAIATARRLGASVSGFDIRAAAGEQVKSLGAAFLSSEVVSQSAEDKGGYAKAQAEDERQRTLETIHKHIVTQDMVITTAQIPNRPAPKLITNEMVAAMRPGSVIVDVAADTGGNTTLTKPGETVRSNGVAILAPLNLAATEPVHASQMFSKNIETFINHIAKDGALKVDLADEITKAMAVTHNGELLRK